MYDWHYWLVVALLVLNLFSLLAANSTLKDIDFKSNLLCKKMGT